MLTNQSILFYLEHMLNEKENKRIIAKRKTRNAILEKTKKLFTLNGILNTSSRMIARECGIANGTLFAHFENVDHLIREILMEMTRTFFAELKSIETKELSAYLEEYLDFVSQNEDFYCMIAVEYPFYSEEIQRIILAVEVIIRDGIFSRLKTTTFDFTPTEIINVFFSQLEYYLRYKKKFIESGSVVNRMRQTIIRTTLAVTGEHIL